MSQLTVLLIWYLYGTFECSAKRLLTRFTDTGPGRELAVVILG